MDADALAALHARCFTDKPPPWSAQTFRDMMATPTVRLFTLPDGLGVAVIRIVGPEAELLTLCTDPRARRRGSGRRLLEQALQAAACAGAEQMFLEVAETNAAARGLYAALGFRQAGYRRDYYSCVGRKAVSALVLSCALAPTGTAPARVENRD